MLGQKLAPGDICVQGGHPGFDTYEAQYHGMVGRDDNRSQQIGDKITACIYQGKKQIAPVVGSVP